MAQEILKDRMGNRIGTIETDSCGIQVVKDKYGSKLGSYDPKSNVTKDKYGNRVGTGNLLTSLLR